MTCVMKLRQCVSLVPDVQAQYDVVAAAIVSRILCIIAHTCKTACCRHCTADKLHSHV